MASIVGKYQNYKNENLDEYFTAAGLSFMVRKLMNLASPTMEITLDGDYIVIKTEIAVKTVEIRFKFGEEFEESLPDNITTKNVATKISDTEFEVKTVICGTGVKCGRVYKFDDKECIITLTHEKAASPAVRYFRRI